MFFVHQIIFFYETSLNQIILLESENLRPPAVMQGVFFLSLTAYSGCMDIRYIDMHSHLNISPLYEKRAAIVATMREEGIVTITVGTDVAMSKKAIEISEEFPGVSFATVGLHPNDNADEVFDMGAYEKLAAHERVVAIGECGLDYFRNQDADMKSRQKELFIQHIRLAEKTNKPLMIHARPSKGSMDAYEDVCTILTESKTTAHAHFHFYVGTIDMTEKLLTLGATFSFDGPITFSSDYDEVIQYLPLDRIMAETDAPFAAPLSHRGKTCEPWMVKEIVAHIARIKHLDEEEVRLATVANAKRIFGV